MKTSSAHDHGGWNATFTNSLSSFLREDEWQRWQNFIVKHCQIYISSSMNKCATQMALLATCVSPKLKVDVTIQNWFQQRERPYMISTLLLEGGTKKENKRKGGCVIGYYVTRGEGLKKSENFADIIDGSS